MSTVDQLSRELVSKQAAKLKAELVGATLYGQPVDLDDPDVLMVLAYEYGRYKQGESARAKLEQMEDAWGDYWFIE